MSEDYYNVNMQLALYVVKELHRRGYERLHVIPSVSPSGMSWRCKFYNSKLEEFCASFWIYDIERDSKKKINLSVAELADAFERENRRFLEDCKGFDSRYVQWYGQMVDSLKVGELPYASADYFQPTDYWKTTQDRKINVLPEEIALARRHY